MTTNTFAAKRAIYKRLQEHAATGLLSQMGEGGGPLQINQSNATRDMQNRCIYPGGAVFDRDLERSVQEGDRTAWRENTNTLWFVRVRAEADTAAFDVDEIAEEIGVVLGRIFAAEPNIAGGASRSYITGGMTDYSATDKQITVLMYTVRTESDFEE